jgi:hypothetical protein
MWTENRILDNPKLLISSFRRVLLVLFVILDDLSASEFDVPT